MIPLNSWPFLYQKFILSSILGEKTQILFLQVYFFNGDINERLKKMIVCFLFVIWQSDSY